MYIRNPFLEIQSDLYTDLLKACAPQVDEQLNFKFKKPKQA